MAFFEGLWTPFAFSRSSIRPESITDCQKKSESRLLTGPAALAGLSPSGPKNFERRAEVVTLLSAKVQMFCFANANPTP